MYEAQQAFYYGLPWNLALASVMSNPAEVIGMDHRLGYINKGILLKMQALIRVNTDYL